jgi:hypothetical protein
MFTMHITDSLRLVYDTIIKIPSSLFDQSFSYPTNSSSMCPVYGWGGGGGGK